MQNYLLLGTLRFKKNLTQQDVAKILEVTLSTYKEYEAGSRAMNLAELNILSNYYNVSLNALLGITKNLKCVNDNKYINYKMLSFYLKYIRHKYHYTQKDLGRKFNVGPNSISKYETRPRTVSIYYLQCFAKEFNVSIDYICDKTKIKEVF